MKKLWEHIDKCQNKFEEFLGLKWAEMDLNEMEDFADEEEDMLPDEAFGKPEKKQKNKSINFLNRSSSNQSNAQKRG